MRHTILPLPPPPVPLPHPSPPQLVASVTALPPCAPRVCCSASPPSTTHRLKATKLCALTAVPPALAPAPVVATCLFGAYHAGGGFGACPGAAAGPPPPRPPPPAAAAHATPPCAAGCADGGSARRVCDLVGFPATCDVYNRLFRVRPAVARLTAAVGAGRGGGGATWADVDALLQAV